MFNDVTINGNLMAFKTLRNVIGHGPNGYTQNQYKAIIDYLIEVAGFKDCWERIWSDTKLRFGVEPSELAVNYTLPVLKKIKGKVLWDLGAGTGRDSIFLSKYCKDVVCVEVAKTATSDIGEQILKENIENIEIINDDVWSALKRQNNLKKGSVDVIHAHSFLHYTKPTMTDVVFSEMHELLKKSGKLVFAVKGKGDHLYGKGEETEKDVWVYYDGQRRKFYDEKSISKVLNKVGFKIELLKTEKEYFDNNISEFVIGVASKT